jgi:hypothetical protein
MAAAVDNEATGRARRGRNPVMRRVLRRQLVAVCIVAAIVIVLLLVPTIKSSGGTWGAIPADVTVPAEPGTSGVTVAGVQCRPGVRQIPWSKYAPICLPAWHGNNGGATWNGVTAHTITLSYRMASTTELAFLYSILPPSVVGTNNEAVRTMQAYVNTFNHYFELYGRRVVLVPFNGQGNFINEDTGTGQQQAEADAVTVATKLHAFADMSLIDSSTMYDTALSGQGVVTFGLYLQDYSWYAAHAPYEYTPGPNCTKDASAIGALLGHQLAGLPAIYAGSPAIRAKIRSYGILYPANPGSTLCAQDISQELRRYGAPVRLMDAFTFNLSELPAQLTSALAQMKNAGVTTVICSSCDPVTPILMMSAAQSQGYYPEWFMQSYFAQSDSGIDPFIQLVQKAAPGEVGGIIGTGVSAVPTSSQEAIRAYEMSHGGNTRGIMPSYPFAYGSLMMFFDALQAAGPYLTPKTFEQGLANTRELPPSVPGGMLGGWSFGPGTFDPASNFQVVHWYPNVTSPEDGEPGTFLTCDGGKVASFAEPAAVLPAHSQLDCPKA